VIFPLSSVEWQWREDWCVAGTSTLFPLGRHRHTRGDASGSFEPGSRGTTPRGVSWGAGKEASFAPVGAGSGGHSGHRTPLPAGLARRGARHSNAP
jgi:hypothetical protein